MKGSETRIYLVFNSRVAVFVPVDDVITKRDDTRGRVWTILRSLRGCIRAQLSSVPSAVASTMASSTRRLNSLIGTATTSANPFNDTDEVFMKKHGYVLGGTLGKGSYAKVKSATKDRERKKVAVKIMDRRKAATEFREKFLPREIAIAPELKHPNVVETYAVYQNKDKVHFMRSIVWFNVKAEKNNRISHWPLVQR